MAQTDTAQTIEHQPSADSQDFLEIPQIDDNSFRSETSLALAQTVNTDAFRAMTGGEQTDVQKATSTIVNGIWSTTDNSETIFNTLRDLKDKDKLNELIESFDNTYMVGLRTQLGLRFPNSGDRISEILDNKAPVFNGLNQEQLQKVFNRFPELKGVTSPEVLGAMVENEVDHTVGMDDRLIDGALKAWIIDRVLSGKNDGTESFKTLDPKALKEKAEKSSGLMYYFNKISERLHDRVLKISVGDGQVQIRNILALQDQERAAGRQQVPSLTMSLTKEGSAQLIAAYFTKSIELLNNRQITDPEKNPFMDATRPSVVRGFEEAQRLWDTKDPASMERAVMMTYNPGVKDSMTGEYWGPSRILKYYLGRK